jgi:serine phosphatase RsbU (regulator of sigma subunit)
MKALIKPFLLFLGILAFCFYGAAFAQKAKVDSLLLLVKSDQLDSTKVKHLDELSWESQNIGLYEMAMKYADEQLSLAKQLNLLKEEANAYNNIGVIYRNKGRFSESIDNYLHALKIAEKLNNKSQIATFRGNIGIVYAYQQKLDQSLNYFFEALKIEEELGDSDGIARHLGNISAVYHILKDYSKALETSSKVLKIHEANKNNDGIVSSSINIGAIYYEKQEYSNALNYHLKALKITKTESINKNSVALVNQYIGKDYMGLNENTSAEIYLQKALAITDSIGSVNLKMDILFDLNQLYEKTGKISQAFECYKNAISLKDSIFSQDKTEEITRAEMNYEFEKKEAVSKAENEEKAHQQKIILWSVIFGLSLILLFTGFILRSLNITNKQKKIIEAQNKETQQQKKIIEEKNKDITDSIHYAKRIQTALLRDEEHISKHLPEHFILFLPKDIVSGDFYWAAEKEDLWYFGVADCTGHGVPGAIMSMLGVSFLNDIAFSEQAISPAEILEKLRTRVVQELRQADESIGNKDGMDISLCCLNLKTFELQWAGANNALNYIQAGELKEVKADKQPIGYHPQQKPFTNHQIQLQKGDGIYIYSDGYADQFGGPKGKKLTYKKLDSLIVSNHQLPMKEQKNNLKQLFDDWKGQLEQLDDVCIVGIKL